MAQPNINAREYGSLKLSIPPLAEQKKIAAILGSVDDAIQSSINKLEGLTILKSGLMSDLLSGRVRVEVPA